MKVTELGLFDRHTIAASINTSLETLAVLATDRSFSVRFHVSRNPNATEEICLMIEAYEKFNHLVLE
jgi:hypothetical protein